MQMAKQLSTGRSWLPDWTREVSAKVKSYHGGRLCCSENVVAQFIGLASLSLRGAKRRSNLGGEPNEIATPRQVGARNDERAWRWMNLAATKIWGRDLQEPVSSLVLAVDGADEQDYYLCPWNILHQESAGRSWETKTPQIFLGCSENKQSK